MCKSLVVVAVIERRRTSAHAQSGEAVELDAALAGMVKAKMTPASVAHAV